MELGNLGENLIKTIQQEKQDIEWCKRRELDFERFCADYNNYQKERQEVEQSRKKQADYEQEKEQFKIMEKLKLKATAEASAILLGFFVFGIKHHIACFYKK